MIAVWNQRLEVRGGNVCPVCPPFPLQKVQSPSTTCEWTTTIFASSGITCQPEWISTRKKNILIEVRRKEMGNGRLQDRGPKKVPPSDQGGSSGKQMRRAKICSDLLYAKPVKWKRLVENLLTDFQSWMCRRGGNLEKLKIISWFRLQLFQYEFGASPDSPLFTFTCINTNNLLWSWHNFQLNKRELLQLCTGYDDSGGSAWKYGFSFSPQIVCWLPTPLCCSWIDKKHRDGWGRGFQGLKKGKILACSRLDPLPGHQIQEPFSRGEMGE